MHNTSAIEIPLTVLEAMACNLPVITDRFGGLPDLFQPGDGFYFTSNENDMVNIVLELCKKRPPVKTRDRVNELSWENVAGRLTKIYNSALCK